MQVTGPDRHRTALLLTAGALVGMVLANTSTARAAWDEIARVLSPKGAPAPASANVLSVEGLAYLATDETIPPLLDVFHDDESPMIRERAACSLAQSGMLDRSQRMKAVPKLIAFAGDGGLDEQTRGWAFQALRDITGQTLPHDPAAWRAWFDHRG